MFRRVTGQPPSYCRYFDFKKFHRGTVHNVSYVPEADVPGYHDAKLTSRIRPGLVFGMLMIKSRGENSLIGVYELF